MDEKHRNELRKKIKSELEDLKSNIDALEDTTDPVAPDQAIGRLSRLDTMLNQGVNKSSISQSKHRILKLEVALARLDDDPFFGECAECGNPIPIARLLALPESELCVKCAE